MYKASNGKPLVRVGDDLGPAEWPTFLNSLLTNPQSRLDWYALALDALMLESGFERREMPDKRGQVTTFKYSLHNCPLRNLCSLRVYPLATSVMISGKREEVRPCLKFSF